MWKNSGGGGGKPKWNVFHHNGPMFPPEFVQHNIPVLFKGRKVDLPKLAEEYATLFAKYLDTEYYKNPKFKKNFWIDFKYVLPDYLKDSNIDDFDFSLIKKYIDEQNEIKRNRSKEEKQKEKEENEKIEEPYTICYIDGAQQKVGNYKIEPPGIFLGRGNHPKIGRVKKRIFPEDITLNLSKDAPIPKINIKGNHKWGDIIHDRSVVWLATWKDEITGKNKYIFTSMDSIFKSKSDEDKFNLAKKLKRKVGAIREQYEKDLNNDDLKMRQLATALYFIDNLALRVGGKKDSKEEADTVGVTSLRVEHITLIEPDTVKLDFLGKDSIKFCKKVKVSKDVYNNIKDFTKNKNKKDDLFDLINSSHLNSYLNDFMDGLTAKVWRTYNASTTFQKELNKVNENKLSSIHESEKLNYLISIFNQANTEVALLCNHQKNVSSDIEGQLKKIDEKVKQLKKMRDKIKRKKSGTNRKERLDKIASKLKLAKIKKDTKQMMKNVSLGTSKTNYIDPRIIFAFIKKYEIPPEKLFTKTLMTRFEWASNVSKDYKF